LIFSQEAFSAGSFERGKVMNSRVHRTKAVQDEIILRTEVENPNSYGAGFDSASDEPAKTAAESLAL
jgi:hypothetical protein